MKVEFFHSSSDTSDGVFQVVVTGLFGFSFFWLFALTFLIFDLTGSFKQYKMEASSDKLNMKEVLNAALWTMFNQLVLGIGMSSILHYLSVDTLPPNIRAVPSFYIMMRDLMVTHHLYEITFYTLHRFMHWKPIYNRIHKVHHEWRSPIAVAAIYNHPLEYICASYFPLLIGPTVMGSHISTIWVLIITSIISTTSEHSGYHMPFMKSARFHYYHHSHINECLGSFGLMDYIFGSDVKFRKSDEYSKHRVFFTPIEAKKSE